MPERLPRAEMGAVCGDARPAYELACSPAFPPAYRQVPVVGFAFEDTAGLADARLVPLPSPILPPQGRPPTAGTEVDGQTAVAGYSADESVLGSQSPAAPNGVPATFFQGYRDGGAPYPEERIDAMIQCESSWRIDPGGSHLGLAQFDPGTWATVSGITGFADPYNPYHQGYNVAVWASMISPGTTAGWPSCWWVGSVP